MIVEELVLTARNQFEEVLQYATGANNTQIADMEKGIFQRLLKIGFILLVLYVQKFAVKVMNHHVDKSGLKREFHSLRKQDYFSVFGKIEIVRPYYWRRGSKGIYPADAELNLSEGGFVPSARMGNLSVCRATLQ